MVAMSLGTSLCGTLTNWTCNVAYINYFVIKIVCVIIKLSLMLLKSKLICSYYNPNPAAPSGQEVLGSFLHVL